MFLRQSLRSFVLLVASGPCVAAAEQPKCDRFGDALPQGAIARLGSLRLRNGEQIFTAAFTTDGKTLAAQGNSCMSFWDPATGKLLRRVEFKNRTFVRLRRLCGDGETLIELHPDNRNILTVLDAASGAQRGTLNYGQCGDIQALDASRQGKIVAAVHQRSIALWDTVSGKLLHEFKDLPPTSVVRASVWSWQNAVALTPDGKQLVLPHADGSLYLFDVASGREIRSVEMPPARRGRSVSAALQRLIVSPDGRYLAFGGRGNPLTVCALVNGKRLFEVASSSIDPLRGVAFSPNGRVLAVAEREGIRLLAVPSGKEIRKLPVTNGSSSQLLFSPDGGTLAAAAGFTIRLWDMTAQCWRHPPVGHDGAIHSIAYFSDGKRILSADHTSGMKVWDCASGQTLAQRKNTLSVFPVIDTESEHVRFALFGSAHRWNPLNGRDEARPRPEVGMSTSGQALSPDGRSLAIQCCKSGGSAQKPVFAYLMRLYDLTTGKFKELPGLPSSEPVAQMLFSPDSRRLAARSHDRVTRLWDCNTAKLVRTFKSDGPREGPMYLNLAFAADGRSFLTWSSGLVRVCEIAGSAERLQIPANFSYLTALAYAADGRFVACGQSDGRIFLYSAVSGKQLAQWRGDQGGVRSLAFCRDSCYLASGGANGTILIWKVPQDTTVPVVRDGKEAVSSWQALGDIDAAVANRALAGLSAAPDLALPLFKERLRPIDKLPERQLAQRIDELDHDSFKVRERATRELAQAGGDAAEALRQALYNNPSTESKRRIEDLLSRLKKGGYSRRLRFLRALEVLERIGTPPAKDVLRHLSGKQMPADLAEEVQAGLRRMGDRP